MKKIFLLGASVLMLSSCVTSKQFKDLEGRFNDCNTRVDSLSTLSTNLEGQLADAKTDIANLNRNIDQLVKDTADLGQKMRYLTVKNEELDDLNKSLENNYKKLQRGNQEEIAKTLAAYREAQASLQDREDLLKKMQNDLDIKSKRLQDLEDALAKKDRDVNALKDQVMEALKGFTGSGLTVEMKNGKVYISISEKLLFASGSTVVDPKGVEALKTLAKVLEENQDINITIEGHTDNVPLRSSAVMKDNWDLSVLRANAVLRIILANAKMDQSRLTAAGRGEFLPIAPNDTPENKAKNRRTEIILTPKLDKLFEILE